MEIFVPPSLQNRPVAFSDQFRAFYDPRKDYSRAQKEDLHQWLCDGRSGSPDPGVRLYVGSRIIARELAHTRRIYIDRHDNAGGLGVSHDELDNIIDLAHFDATRTIQGLRRGVVKLFHDNPDIAEHAKTADPELIITFGGMGSALSHLGQFRRSGDAYAVHPWESVMITEVTETRAFGPTLPECYRLQSDIMKYIIYSHDELEDDMSSEVDKRNLSFLAAPKVHMTPLTHYLLLQELGVPEEVADYASDGLLRLTKTVGSSGRLEWKIYIPILASAATVAPEGYEGTVTEAKDIEMEHNSRVDKNKPPRRRDLGVNDYRVAKDRYSRREADYDWARQELHRYVPHLKGYPAAIAGRVATVRPKDIERQKTHRSFASLLEPDKLVMAYFSANASSS